MKLFRKLYPWRFHLFLCTQLLVLFGGLLIPVKGLENLLLSVFLICNLIGGLTIIFQRKRLFYLIVGLILVEFLLAFLKPEDMDFMKGRTALFLLLFLVLFVEIVLQIIGEKKVNSQVIIGMFSGYITLGFIGLFLLQLLMLDEPSALYFNLAPEIDMIQGSSQLMYYSFVTLLTIGYGDIVPVSPAAQKTTILLGLAGQFYLTVVIALIMGKYLRDR